MEEGQSNGARRGRGRGGEHDGAGAQRKRRYQGEEDAEMVDYGYEVPLHDSPTLQRKYGV